MSRPFRLVPLLSAMLLLALCPAGAQTLQTVTVPDYNSLPVWLIVEKGKLAFEQRDYGMALRLFRAAKERQPLYPEVEYWIGAVFEAENEYSLAELQYKKAYSQRNLLEVPQDVFTILYQLAGVYYREQRYNQYVATLKLAIAEHKPDASSSEVVSEQALVRSLRQQGLSMLLVLYRIKDDGTMQAYRDLGVFLYRTGRYTEAVTDLTYSVIMSLTTIINSVFASDPEYQFTTVDTVLTQTAGQKEVQDYVGSSGLYEQLYYLAACLQQEAAKDQATAIWKLVVAHSESGPWAERSRRQLQSPFTEPLLSTGQSG